MEHRSGVSFARCTAAFNGRHLVTSEQLSSTPSLSVVIPVYNNQATLPKLVAHLDDLHERLDVPVEAVFVIDGSPDQSLEVLRDLLPHAGVSSRLLVHARNFGAFAAIRTGLSAARGAYVSVLAADLQEPPELVADFYEILASGQADVVVGARQSRVADPLGVRLSSAAFWWLYRRIVNREIPEGGADVFACTRHVRDVLLSLDEGHSSLIGLLFWVGFRRVVVAYDREERADDSPSGWTLRRRLRYMADSTFSFTDLPIRVLMWVGGIVSLLLVTVAMVVVLSHILGLISVPGYAPLMLLIATGFTVTLFAIGVVGSYTWRAFENTKHRPSSIVMNDEDFAGYPAQANNG
jgi:glycosyltransferase involved in cell wall biosynthesis